MWIVSSLHSSNNWPNGLCHLAAYSEGPKRFATKVEEEKDPHLDNRDTEETNLRVLAALATSEETCLEGMMLTETHAKMDISLFVS